VRLVGNGITDNTSAIGAQVRIELDEMIVARQVESGTGENNSNDPTLHFGLGAQSDPVDLQITWPSGRQDTVEDVALNQLLWVTECIDLDADGFDDVDCGGDDCNDSDDTIRPDAAETWYDGVDSDCVEDSDYDADGDGQDAEEHGGTDCDDSDPDIGDGAPDTWYDGIDSDCGGDSDYDADGDGQDADEYGGTDCNDSNPDVYLGASDPDGDHIDQGCDGDPALPAETSAPKQESGCAHASGSGGLAAALLGMVVLWRRRE
jgi:MYXO-CTERM domain-containing protein